MLTRAALAELLQQRRFAELIGETESAVLEAKGQPYQLGTDEGKFELAKDVAALANGEGGFLLIGLRTAADTTTSADKIQELRPFPEALFDVTQYRQILDTWVYPTMDNLDVRWIATDTPQAGIALIGIPPQPPAKQPFLISKIVVDTGRRRDMLLGYSQRKHDRVEPVGLQELHQLLRDGSAYQQLVAKRFDELDARVAQLAKAQEDARRQLLDPAEVNRRIDRDLREAKLGPDSFIALAAYPDVNISLKTLFTSRPGSIGKLVEDPPNLRQHGFGIWASGTSELIEGNRRRSLHTGDIFDARVLTLYRDGLLLFATDWRHWCWGTNEEGLLNPISLVETVYNFCTMVELVLKDAATVPQDVHLVAIVRQPGAHPQFVLPSGFRMIMGRHAGRIDGARLEATVITPAEPFSAAKAALVLLEELYARFGLESDSVPYTTGTGEERQVSTEALLNIR